MSSTPDQPGGSEPFVPFDPDAGLILACDLPGSSAQFGDHRRSLETLDPNDSPLWIHLDRTKPGAQAWIRERSGLSSYAAHSLLAAETRPRAEAIGDGLLVILRGINMNEGIQADELISIRLWIDPHRIITLRQHRFQTIAELRQRAQAGEAPATPGAFLEAVVSGLSARIAPSIENLREIVDDIEDGMLERDDEDQGWRSRLGTARRQAIGYRRYLVPQRDALQALVANPTALLDEHDRAGLRVSLDQMTRECESLEEIRDRAAVTQDELRARHEARVGRTVYLLTLVATVALPLGLLTGLLGVNVGGIPLTESPAGFWIVVVAMVLISGGQIWWFKRKRWV